MRLGIVGLGKMGANMARRLRRAGIEVVGLDHSQAVVDQLAKEEGLMPATDLSHLVAQLSAPRIVWIMVPSGDPTESTIKALADELQTNDIVIDGGNSNYKASQRRAQWLQDRNIGFVDAGTSGGVWGLQNGYCLMVGGSEPHIKEITPILQQLAPAEDRGWAHVGPAGAGHFTKMIHNGIEYGMMQAFAEGFALMKGKKEFNLDLAQIAELWRHSSVVRSWLLDLTADFLKDDQSLAEIEPYVADSGEGRWTVEEAIEQGTASPVLALALHMRFASQDQEAYGNRMLAMMRNAFGGHLVKGKE